VLAFVLSAFFPGVLGGLYGWYVTYIEPDSVFNAGISLNMLVMTFFGGAGTLWGPVVGAALLEVVKEYLWATLPSVYMIIFGVLLVLNIVVLPKGLVVWLGARGRPAVREAAGL
jgi:branched-chain amino acid transport system permease protein